MKNLNIAYYLSCCLLITILFSCEKADIQNSTQVDHSKIHPRSVPNCGYCAITDCCCSITLLSDDDNINIELCGTSSPDISDEPCYAESVGSCDVVQGYIEYVSLPLQNSSALFCVQKNTPFGITYASGFPQVRLTCQVGQTAPQSVVINLNTPPFKPYWMVNGDCELVSCF